MEVIVALGIILLILVNIAALILINIFSQKNTELRVIGANLAREGIEIVRNLRDSEREVGKAGENVFISDEANHFFAPEFDIDKIPFWRLTVVTGIDEAPVYLDLVDSVYTYRSSAVNAELTPFKRLVTIDYICADETKCTDGICKDEESQCTSTIGYRVTSQVRWREGSKDIDYILVDYLYDWK